MTNAKIYLQVPNNPVAPGSVINIPIYLDTDSAVNAFDISLNYDKGKFTFIGSDNSHSIVDIWQTKPESNGTGQVELSGGILKSFSGVRGEIVKLTFKMNEHVGTGQVSFTKSDVFLADGKGTRVSAVSPGASLLIKENAQVITVPTQNFQSTSSDVAIEQGLQTYKSSIESKETLSITFLSIAGILILVFCIVRVYNKRKRKL